MVNSFQAYYVYKGEKNNPRYSAYNLEVCMGLDLICLLEQVLLFTRKYNEFNSNFNVLNEFILGLNEKSEVLLTSITNVIYRTGKFLDAKPIECANPLEVNNGLGIFIVDLRSRKPTYCIMNHKFQRVTPNKYFDEYRQDYSEGYLIAKGIPSAIEAIEEFNEITVEELKELFPTLHK